MNYPSNAVLRYGKNAHGERVVAGYYAISPDGRGVWCRRHQPLKAGWSFATVAPVDVPAPTAVAPSDPYDD